MKFISRTNNYQLLLQPYLILLLLILCFPSSSFFTGKHKLHSASRSKRSFGYCNNNIMNNDKTLLFATLQEEEEEADKSSSKSNNKSRLTRRNLFQQSTSLIASSLIANGNMIQPSNSMGLVMFPCKEGTLSNTYNAMRAGESLLEESNLLATNQLFLTNRESALSSRGVAQVQSTCQNILSKNNPTVVYFSLAANCVDTSNIIADELNFQRNRILPEFTFLDRRSVGLWDMLPLNTTESAIWALDYNEAGALGLGGRPPPHDDGTAHETLSDEVSRLRQFLSVIETSRAGENVLFIFPDGTGPALLTCLISGIPLNRVHEFELQPGEVRFNITYTNGLQLASESSLSKQKNDYYNNKIKAGNEQLQHLYKTQEDIKKSRDVQLQPVAMAPTTPSMKSRTERKIYATATKASSSSSSSDDNAPGTISSSSGYSTMFGALGVAATAGAVSQKSEEIAGTDFSNKGEKEVMNGKESEETITTTTTTNGVIGTTYRRRAEIAKQNHNVTATSVSIHDHTNVRTTTSASLRDDTNVRTTTTSASLYDDIPLYNDNENDLFLIQKEIKENLAKDAMDEYMNQDDGFDDYFASLNDIMNGDE